MQFEQNERNEDEERAVGAVPGLHAVTESSASSKQDLGKNDNDSQEDDEKEDPEPKKRRKAPQVQDMSELKLAPYPFYCYTDHSRDLDIKRQSLKDQAGHVPNFLLKLHAILSDPNLTSIISWDTHGRSFRILKSQEFEEKILPLFFEHSSLASFQRQVNCWCFRHLKQGPNRGSYYEEHFLR